MFRYPCFVGILPSVMPRALQVAVLLVSALAGPCVLAEADPEAPRLLFNSDNGTANLFHHDLPMTAKKMCRVVDDLEGLPVDVFLPCPQFGDDTVIYPTKVAEFSDGRHLGDDQHDEEAFGTWRQNVSSLHEQGIDPIETHIRRARELGMQLWPSIRMNDIHKDWTDRWPSLRSRWEIENKHLAIGADYPRYYDRIGKDFTWALDFAQQAVRDHKFAVIDELCTNYDVDGMAMDFLRHPLYFKRGQARAGMPLMTGFVRRVRERLTEIGRERGRPLHLHARMGRSFKESEAMGLDVRTWIKEGLVDSITVGNHDYLDQGTDVRSVTEAAKGTGILISGGLEYSVRDYGGHASIEMLRAAASAYWYQGADSLYLFNYDCHGPFPLRGDKRQALVEIADPKLLLYKNKHYFITKDVDRLLPSESGDKQLPFLLEKAGDAQRFDFVVGDDLAEAEAIGMLKAVRLRVTVKEHDPKTQQVQIRLNDQEPGLPQVNGNVLVFGYAPARQGANHVDVSLGEPDGKGAPPLRIEGIELLIEYSGQ